MTQRFLYLWFPQLAVGRYILNASSPEQPADLAQSPFATTASDHRGTYLCGVNALAHKKGLRPTMRLGDARAILPELKTLPNAPEQDKAELLKLAALADQFSPWIALDGPHLTTGEGGLWLDMSGAAHLFGGEEALLETVEQTYAPTVTALHLGMADTALAAWASARFHTGNPRLKEGETLQETQDFPLAALDIPAQTVQNLNRLGLRTLSDLRELPRANLTTRFGPDLLDRLDRMVGSHAPSLSFLHTDKPYEVIRFFPDPLGSQEIVRDTVVTLLTTLCHDIKEAGFGIRMLGIRFNRVDGHVISFPLKTSAPVQDVSALMRLLDNQLPGVDPGFGIEQIHMRALHSQWVEQTQVTLGNDEEQNADSGALSGLIDHLRQRLGSQAVTYMHPQASHLPERAFTYSSQPSKEHQSFPTLPERPIRLLNKPEPIKIDNSHQNTVPQSFIWRKQRIEAQHISGPERLTREWWHDLKLDFWNARLGMRDYYRIQDQAGRDLWLCCSYAQDNQARWFVHGWFG
ncbi:Y-family DNA polymerase [Terasakiella sp.]|uniref:Y-family DNA polymerase n=1 Tax=Terasakiella sp. TaxID=2034861 RepID=UPI003AA7C672